METIYTILQQIYIRETVYQFQSESQEFCRRYYKNILVSFFLDTLCIVTINVVIAVVKLIKRVFIVLSYLAYAVHSSEQTSLDFSTIDVFLRLVVQSSLVSSFFFYITCTTTYLQ